MQRGVTMEIEWNATIQSPTPPQPMLTCSQCAPYQSRYANRPACGISNNGRAPDGESSIICTKTFSRGKCQYRRKIARNPCHACDSAFAQRSNSFAQIKQIRANKSPLPHFGSGAAPTPRSRPRSWRRHPAPCPAPPPPSSPAPAPPRVRSCPQPAPASPPWRRCCSR